MGLWPCFGTPAQWELGPCAPSCSVAFPGLDQAGEVSEI